MERTRYTEIAAKLFCAVAAAVLVWFVFEYAIGIILPFAIALGVGAPTYALSVRLNKKFGLPQKLSAFILILLFLSALAFLVGLAVNRLFVEIEELIEWIGEDKESVGRVVGVVFGYVSDLASKIPFIDEIENIEGLENFGQTVNDGVADILGEMITGFTASIPARAMNIIKRTPRAFITVIVTLLSAFYFGMDFGRIRDGAISLLPRRSGERFSRWSAIFGKALKRYGRAYLLIMLLTFVEVFVGLLTLGKRYAFILAIVVAIVDILPVFGAGTVLIPWAAVALLMKDYQTGMGLLALYGVITIVRQIAEPRIVGDSLGIHPLVTLIAMFAGLSLFGLAGMLLGPFVVMIVKEILDAERE